MKPLKILIASPARDYDWVNSAVLTFTQLTHTCPSGSNIDIQIESGLVHSVRNLFWKKAFRENFDYLFMLDSDTALMGGPQSTISYLIEQAKRQNADIIGGIYVVAPGGGPKMPSALMLGKDGYSTISWPDKITAVDACGAGFMLITEKVIQAFTPEIVAGGGEPFDHIPMKDYPHTDGEDLAFCYRARKMGFKIMVDPAFDLGHVKPSMWRKKG